MVAFILGDLFSSGNSMFGGNQTEVGEIGGQSIDGIAFEKKVQESIENYKRNYNIPSVDAAVTEQIREQTWNTMTQDILYGEEYDLAGIRISQEELEDMFLGDNIHQQVAAAFKNPETGQFDLAGVKKAYAQAEEDEDLSRRLIDFENDIKRLRLMDKFHTLIQKGLTYPQFAGKDQYVSQETKYNISLVAKRYNAIPDSSVDVTDADVKRYYNDNKKDYEQEASRDIEFVTFRVDPSVDDVERISQWFSERIEEFKTTENDTVFINRNSDSRFNAQWVKSGATGLSPEVDTLMFASEVGHVHGPYQDGFTWKAVKLLGIKESPDSVEARHILIDLSQGEERSKELADSLYEAIQAGADFAQLAKDFSNDPGSGIKGGELGKFVEGQMVPEFNDACFDGETGDMVVVRSQFGHHIIDVMDQIGNSEKRRMTVLERTVEASTKTRQGYYANADEFARSVSGQDSFEAEIASRNLNKRYGSNLKQSDSNIPGLESPRQVIRWAYESEKGDVSKVFELGDDFVVAILSEVREEGFTAIDDIKDELEVKVIKEKKAEMFIAEMETASNGAASIQDVATKLQIGSETKTGVTFASGVIQGFGRELEVVGTMAGLEQGELSKPIKGEQGVYVVTVDSRIDAPELANYLDQAKTLETAAGGRVSFDVLNALKEKGEIVDNRGKFY